MTEAASVQVRGGPSPEEVAAVLAALTRAGSDQRHLSAYERWRATRLQVLRRDSE